MAGVAGLRLAFVPGIPPDLFAGLLRVEARELDAGAEAGVAPAMFRIEREEPRVEFGIAGAAGRTGPFGGEDLHVQFRVRAGRVAIRDRRNQPVERGEITCSTPLPNSSVAAIAARSSASRSGTDHEVGDRQFDRVFLEPVQAWPALGAHEGPVDAQMGVALALGPLGQIGVVALARHDERGEQADMFAAIVAKDAREDLVGALRLDCGPVGRAVLHAELHVEQAQEVIDLGQRRDGALASAAAGPLFDRDGRRNAEESVDIRPGRRAARTGAHRHSTIRDTAAGPRRR